MVGKVLRTLVGELVLMDGEAVEGADVLGIKDGRELGVVEGPERGVPVGNLEMKGRVDMGSTLAGALVLIGEEVKGTNVLGVKDGRKVEGPVRGEPVGNLEVRVNEGIEVGKLLGILLEIVLIDGKAVIGADVLRVKDGILLGKVEGGLSGVHVGNLEVGASEGIDVSKEVGNIL